MQKSLFTLGIVALMLLSFNYSQAKTNGNSSANPAETVSSNDHATVKLTKALFLEKVWDYENSPKEWKFKGDKPALIDFYADWCGPCRTAAPILEEIAGEFKEKVVIYKVDTMVETELKAIFGVQGIPAFLYIPMQGKPTMTSGIARSKEDTKKMFITNIEKLLLANN
ncbi:thioredoxin domain-containing protein [Prolixibacteraceae bacterium Z1-6]|uniref:Thioredoxin domain-containing protein n=1 Tax=Draconibacterium aestuarii TaxID=2998507 RepID=A0A9X3FBZ4_9BACT|nr:thioredoxin domain-containing protein [Prolixibacteraceae bacterium Z1-6]